MNTLLKKSFTLSIVLFLFLQTLHAESYRNFRVAIYCTVWDVAEMADLERLEKAVDLIEEYVIIDKVYLETHRRDYLIDEAILSQAIGFFEKRGIKTSGGITTTGSKSVADHFPVYCYTDMKEINHLKEVVQFTALHFDEIIIDDFYFTSCRCTSCIKAKGDRSWTDFRLELMKDISRDVVLKTAKEIKPGINMIIKYPNWYDYYQNTGYNLADQPEIFDMIYTGTETRDPVYHQQHMQPYHGYLIMRYMDNVKPGKNGGGWVDPLDMRTWNRYAEQLSLTLYAGADEITLFRFGSLIEWISEDNGKEKPLSVLAPVAGYVFDKSDLFLHKLGNPVGLSVYKPYNSSGEPYLPAYLGMLGIPLEMTPEFSSNEMSILLTASSAADKDIIDKMKTHLSEGKNLIITSGFLKAMQNEGIKDIIEATYTDRKLLAKAFTDLQFRNIYPASDPFIIPVIDFPTNDGWKEVAAINDGDSYPIVLKSQYGDGMIYILTIPDTFSDLYKIPSETLSLMRGLLLKDLEVVLDAPARVSIFLYDNNSFIVQSFLPFKTDISLKIKNNEGILLDLLTGKELDTLEGNGESRYTFNLQPFTYKVFEIK